MFVRNNNEAISKCQNTPATLKLQRKVSIILADVNGNKNE